MKSNVCLKSKLIKLMNLHMPSCKLYLTLAFLCVIFLFCSISYELSTRLIYCRAQRVKEIKQTESFSGSLTISFQNFKSFHELYSCKAKVCIWRKWQRSDTRHVLGCIKLWEKELGDRSWCFSGSFPGHRIVSWSWQQQQFPQHRFFNVALTKFSPQSISQSHHSIFCNKSCSV